MSGLLALGVLSLSTAAFAGDPAATCESSKLGTVAKYDSCHLKADSKVIKSGGTLPGDYTKCSLDKFTDAQDKATAAGGSCPTNDDQTDIQNFVDACTSSVAAALEPGGSLPLDVLTCNEDLDSCTGDLGSCDSSLTTCNSHLTTCQSDLSTTNADLGVCEGNLAACESAAVCGDGTIAGGEDCDVGTLGGTTCVALGFAGGTLNCATGCTFDTSHCYATRLVDNGDGTITDNETELVWEKKDTNCPGVHCWTDTYSWQAAMSDFLSKLNRSIYADCNPLQGDGFAGSCSWRLPTHGELRSIDDFSGHPSIAPIFGPTQAAIYWAAVSWQTDPSYGYYEEFYGGGTGLNPKTSLEYVRAVRTLRIPIVE